MALTLQECIDKIKKEYPKHFPYAYIEVKGKYVFSIVQKGYDPHKAISDLHIVDPETGYVSGGLSIMDFLKNPQFREAWKKPNLVANHDESLGHSSVFTGGRTRGWAVRKLQNGRSGELHSRNAADEQSRLQYGGSLSHYGIKGQSWGVKNGPPYPLDQKTHNKVIKNAGKTSKAGAGYDSEGGQRTGLIPELAVLATLIGVQLYNSNPKVQDRRKSKKQKEFNEKNRNVSEDLLGDIQDMDKRFDDENPPRLIVGNHSIEDDMLACNPRFKNGTVEGTTSNCTLCAFTYDMRRRGYDVAALASETGNYPDQIIKDLYKDPKEDKFKARNFADLFKQAADKYPEGSRGEIHLMGPFIGHSMAWEIQNHQLVVIDPQRNEKHSAQQLKEFGFEANHPGNGFIRTDNLEVKLSGMNNICAEYKSDGLKTAKVERAKTKLSDVGSSQTGSKATTGVKTPSEAERRKKYEEAYLKEHPNADKNSEGLRNWVESQMNK